MNNPERRLTPTESADFLKLTEPLAAEANNTTTGRIPLPRGLDMGLMSEVDPATGRRTIPAGHIAMMGDFEFPVEKS